MNKVNELIPYFEDALHTIYNDTLIPLYFSETFNVLELLCTDSLYQFYKRTISLEQIIPLIKLFYSILSEKNFIIINSVGFLVLI